MSELARLKQEIARLKAQELRASKLSRAKSQVRELKYGKYLRPGRRAVGWVKKQVSKSGSSGDSNMFGGLDIGDPFGNSSGGGPLADLGSPMGGISLGNPFGEERTHRTHHRRAAHRRIHHRRRPQYIIVRR